MLNAADSDLSSTADSVASRPDRKPVLLYAVIALAVLNSGFLIGLAWFTSSPVVLNPYQIRTSSLVVTASLESFEQRAATLKIEKIWKGAMEEQTIRVRGLSAAHMRGHDVWIVPLQQQPTDQYVVTPLKHANSANSKQLLYPADPETFAPTDPETLNKLKSLLSPDDSSL